MAISHYEKPFKRQVAIGLLMVRVNCIPRLPFFTRERTKDLGSRDMLETAKMLRSARGAVKVPDCTVPQHAQISQAAVEILQPIKRSIGIRPRDYITAGVLIGP